MSPGNLSEGSAGAKATGDSSDQPFLDAKQVTFAYGKVTVLQGTSLALPKGAMCALIGANGSGKSTLIRLLAGIAAPLGGVVSFNGLPLTTLDPRERAKLIAYVPQNSATVFPFTALEVVLTGRSPYLSRFRFEDRKDVEIARAALAALDAAHLAARPVTELSGGERQLVAVARALAQEPQVMLLDEPSSALDLKHRTQLVRALRRLRDGHGITVLMITHDLMILERTFDAVYAMKDGIVVAEGTPEAVLSDDILTYIYDAPIRTVRSNERTFVWSEL
jgi:iron complex transport system ATP-binding protein